MNNDNCILHVDTFLAALPKKMDKESGKVASKIKFTTLTNVSLKKNILTGKIDDRVKKYNELYRNLLNQFNRKTELESMMNSASVLNNSGDVRNGLHVKNEEIDSNIKKIIDKILRLHFAMLKDIEDITKNKKIKLVGKLKALKVPEAWTEYVRKIKLKKLTATQGIITEKGNWQAVFSGVESRIHNTSPLKSVTAVSKPVIQNNNKINEQALIAQYGTILSHLRSILTNGTVSEELAAGLQMYIKSAAQKLNSLVGTEITNIDDLKNDNVIEKETPIQEQIANITGIKSIPTEDEHEKNSQFYEQFFTSKEQLERMHALMQKDYLDFFNEPDVARNIDAAEKLADNQDLKEKSPNGKGDVQMANTEEDQLTIERIKEMAQKAALSIYLEMQKNPSTEYAPLHEIINKWLDQDYINSLATQQAREIVEQQAILEEIQRLAEQAAIRIIEEDKSQLDIEEIKKMAMEMAKQLMNNTRDFSVTSDRTLEGVLFEQKGPNRVKVPNEKLRAIVSNHGYSKDIEEQPHRMAA